MRNAGWLVAVSLALVSSVAVAGKKPAKPAPPPPPAEVAAPEPEPEAEPDPLADYPHVTGPQLVQLGHGAELDLPAGLTLFEAETAQRLLRELGSNAEGAVAAIIPSQDQGTWAIVIEAQDVGYVSDRDADELDADAMLAAFKQGTLAQNAERRKLGVAELFVDGWTERPRYERAEHHLVWGLEAHDADGKVVNFFTRFLGRHGYLSVNLIDSPENIAQSKQQVLSILTALRFQPGSRYSDHVDSDRDSGLGLKALVLGGAGVVLAKKTGILIAILLALKKGAIVIVAAIAGFFKWLFGRGRGRTDSAPPSVDPPVG
jgi:uncharacterized membrane-anchored protein